MSDGRLEVADDWGGEYVRVSEAGMSSLEVVKAALCEVGRWDLAERVMHWSRWGGVDEIMVNAAALEWTPEVVETIFRAQQLGLMFEGARPVCAAWGHLRDQVNGPDDRVYLEHGPGWDCCWNEEGWGRV